MNYQGMERINFEPYKGEIKKWAYMDLYLYLNTFHVHMNLYSIYS